MQTSFAQGKYEIYWYKGQAGDTPMAPISPVNSIAVSPQNKTSVLKKGAAFGVGIAVASRVINTVRQEIGRTTGNEALQTNINNAMKVIGYAGAVAVGGYVGAIYVATDIALNAMTFSRDLERKNYAANYNAKLQGKRINISSGSTYYG